MQYEYKTIVKTTYFQASRLMYVYKEGPNNTGPACTPDCDGQGKGRQDETSIRIIAQSNHGCLKTTKSNSASGKSRGHPGRPSDTPNTNLIQKRVCLGSVPAERTGALTVDFQKKTIPTIPLWGSLRDAPDGPPTFQTQI